MLLQQPQQMLPHGLLRRVTLFYVMRRVPSAPRVTERTVDTRVPDVNLKSGAKLLMRVCKIQNNRAKDG